MGITDEKARCSNPECGKEIGWNEQYGHITHPVCFDCWLQGKSLFLEYDNLTPYAQATVCKKGIAHTAKWTTPKRSAVAPDAMAPKNRWRLSANFAREAVLIASVATTGLSGRRWKELVGTHSH